MKVKINDLEYPLVMPGDWTFHEALTVQRLTSPAGAPLTPGACFVGLLHQEPQAALAVAIVGHMRSNPGEPPDFLLDLKVSRIVVDLSDDKEAESGPPADRGGRKERPAAAR